MGQSMKLGVGPAHSADRQHVIALGRRCPCTVPWRWSGPPAASQAAPSQPGRARPGTGQLQPSPAPAGRTSCTGCALSWHSPARAWPAQQHKARVPGGIVARIRGWTRPAWCCSLPIWCRQPRAAAAHLKGAISRRKTVQTRRCRASCCTLSLLPSPSALTTVSSRVRPSACAAGCSGRVASPRTPGPGRQAHCPQRCAGRQVGRLS